MNRVKSKRQSSEHGIIPGRLSQTKGPALVAAQVLLSRWIAAFWWLLVVAGYCGLLGIGSSTLSAQPVVRQLAAKCSIASPQVAATPDHVLAGIFSVPLAGLRGRRPRILIYARYSTDEQDISSIEDQVAKCRKQLKAAGFEGDIEVLYDPGISGELRERPAIDQVRAGVLVGRWDLIICEDSSRLFRNETMCFELVETAVDEGARVICINDKVDTKEDDWAERLHDAQRHHQKSNKYTRERISRKIDALWELNAAVGPLRVGHIRKRAEPNKEEKRKKPPAFDEKDPRWEPIIVEAFRRVRAKEHPLLVCQYLTEQKLPKGHGAKDHIWREKDLYRLIRAEIYRGMEAYGKIEYEKKLRTGKGTRKKRPADKVRWREMPHLRMVSDKVWNDANAVIDEYNPGCCHKKGPEHALWGIPRNSRCAASNILICDVCLDKVHGDGRNEGGYRCRNARKRKCWNKATAVRSFAHKQISLAVVSQLVPTEEHTSALMEYAAGLLRSEDIWEREEQRLIAKVRDLRTKCEKLGKSIESTDEPPKTLVKLLAQREGEVEEAHAELADWESQRESFAQLPTAEELLERFHRAAERLLDFDRGAGALLETLLVGKIRMVPYQLFQSNKVVSRAEFELNLAKILPENLTALLNGSADCQVHEFLPVKAIRVDLFKESPVTKYALLAHELEAYLTLVEIGELLGMSKRSAHLAVQLGRDMRAAGIDDPYIRLERAPEAASRWRSRSTAELAELRFNRRKKRPKVA